MSRMVLYSACVALTAFVGGAVVGSRRDHVREPSRDLVSAATESAHELTAQGPVQKADTGPEVANEPFDEAAPHAPAETPGVPAGSVEPAPASDALRRAIELYRRGDMSAGDRAKADLLDPMDRKIAEWVAARFGPRGWDRIAEFSRENPDWHLETTLTRLAEEALVVSGKPAALVRAFAQQQPTTAEGKIALAFALKADGAAGEAAAAVRDVWRNHMFGSDLESKVLAGFPAVLSEPDHRERMERFLARENWLSALRVSDYVGKDYSVLARARIAVARGATDAQSALGAVPTSLHSNKSYLLARVQSLRRQDNLNEAVQVLTPLKNNDLAPSADGDQWWIERRAIARKLLDRGDALAAYAVARDHNADSAEKRIEAEFHAGWIALRFLSHPATAALHFANAARIATKPISVARVLYWQGRAAETLGARSEARAFYERAAAHSMAYYGQLARAKLVIPQVELRTVEPIDPPGLEFEVGRVVSRLYEVGYRDLALVLCTDLARSSPDPRKLDALAQVVAANDDAQTLLAIGKMAVERGYPLDSHAFPLLGVPHAEPVGRPVEKAMIYAVVRQESAFAAGAQSPAGARGLMQLMPETARRTAKRFGIEFDVARLFDPAYNTQLGAAHLGELAEDWKGFPILMFAAYNAGGGNVSNWIKAFGDPRSPSVDPIDWVERIPFSETRNYVQRVTEGLLVYRHRFSSWNTSRDPTEAAFAPTTYIP
jgi:soluble lytic murein transglycosylase